MNRVLVVVVTLLLLVCSTQALPFFIKERMRMQKRMLSTEVPHGFKLAPEQYFTQRLDHFRADLTTYEQRFFENSTVYNGHGPLFLYVGGESAVSPRWMVHSAYADYATEYGGLMVMLEHRFYGKSQPFTDTSTEHLQYLSSAQALEDLAAFVQFIRQKHGMQPHQKTVVFGGSYPGALAAWARSKYPNIVNGAVASSGPVVAKLDFQEYMEVVASALDEMSGSPACRSTVADATAALAKQLATDAGRSAANKLFKGCTPLTSDQNDLTNFAATLMGNWQGIVQYNDDNRGHGVLNVERACAVMNNKTDGLSPLEKYAAVNTLLLKQDGAECMDYAYNSMIDELKNTTLDAAQMARQWTYQTCTEFAFFQTTTSDKQPFGDAVPLAFYEKMCADIFSADMTHDYIAAMVDQSNDRYGGLAGGYSNTVFANGDVDPWHALSVLKHNPTMPSVQALFIKGTAHCANMYPPSEHDLPQLKAMRAQIMKTLKLWV